MKYFETKVVRVKKEKEEWKPGMCPCCGAKREAEQPKGNWVNGENLDKIKFPCFCSFTFPKVPSNPLKYKHIGIINKIGGINDQYILTDADKQYNQTGCLLWMQPTLKDLIKYFDIHILKGKIIIYEDDMEDKYSDE